MRGGIGTRVHACARVCAANTYLTGTAHGATYVRTQAAARSPPAPRTEGCGRACMCVPASGCRHHAHAGACLPRHCSLLGCGKGSRVPHGAGVGAEVGAGGAARGRGKGWRGGWGVPASPLTLVTQTTSEYFHVMHKQVKNSLIQTQRANRKGPGPAHPLPLSPPAGRAAAPWPPAHRTWLPADAASTAPRAGRGPGRAPRCEGSPAGAGVPGRGRRGAGAWSSVGGQVPGSTKCRSTGLRGERESGPKLALERGHRSENLPDRWTDGRQGENPRATLAPAARPATLLPAPWGHRVLRVPPGSPTAPAPASVVPHVVGKPRSPGASCSIGHTGTDAHDLPEPSVLPWGGQSVPGPARSTERGAGRELHWRLPAPAQPALSRGEHEQHGAPQPREQMQPVPLLSEHGMWLGPVWHRTVPWRL